MEESLNISKGKFPMQLGYITQIQLTDKNTRLICFLDIKLLLSRAKIMETKAAVIRE